LKKPIHVDPSSLENVYEGSRYYFSSYTNLLFNSEKYVDIYFVVKGQKVPAHKIVLCLRCKYFAQLFASKFDGKTVLNKIIFKAE